MIFIPELKLKALIDSLLAELIRDIQDNDTAGTPMNSILFEALDGYNLGEFNLYEQARELFLRTEDHSRKIRVGLFFDSQKAHNPCLHLTLPSEEKGQMDSIGVGEGNEDEYYNEDTGEVSTFHTRSFNTQFRVVITSDNTMEVVILYHVFKTLFISMLDIVELSGFRKVVLGGNDIQVNSNLVPANIFLRALTLSFNYETSVSKIDKQKLINSINFTTNLILE